MSDVPATFVDHACRYCDGRVLRGYKHRRGYQKCLRCSRVSYARYRDSEIDDDAVTDAVDAAAQFGGGKATP